MTYYANLVTAWNLSSASPGVLPANTTGTSLYGLTTAQKIAAVNSWIQTGSVPTTIYVTGAQVLNAINWTEFVALTDAQRKDILLLCACQGLLLSGSANLTAPLPGMLLAYFTNHSGPTITALTTLAAAQVQSWWQANGFPGPFDLVDISNAGLS
jgi:hypothetical protein